MEEPLSDLCSGLSDIASPLIEDATASPCHRVEEGRDAGSVSFSEGESGIELSDADVGIEGPASDLDTPAIGARQGERGAQLVHRSFACAVEMHMRMI